MRAALIQLNTGNVIEDAITVAEGFIREAVEQGVAFVSTPETTHLMEMNRTLVLEKTFPEDQDPGVKRFRALAAELGIWLHIGSLIIKVADNRLANRSFLFSPEGEMIATYDKMHLF
ncbi:MAG: carbon-nitrogen hydrolase family protein, partial [Alphaproteobacteria bacterium]|nr:carbon-nitrogen hydrolase family protein [Alphaproteobacteria bacterium]